MTQPVQKKKPFKIYISGDVEEALHRLGSKYQLSGNLVLAAAAGELAKVTEGDLWHALGRIASETAAPVLPPPSPSRIAAKKERPVLTVS